jgi:hypothetical protein
VKEYTKPSGETPVAVGEVVVVPAVVGGGGTTVRPTKSESATAVKMRSQVLEELEVVEELDEVEEVDEVDELDELDEVDNRVDRAPVNNFIVSSMDNDDNAFTLA